MLWTDLSPDARDFIIRVFVQVTERGVQTLADFIAKEFRKTFGEPGARVVEDIHDLSVQINKLSSEPKWYQLITRPNAEHRDMLRLQNLLNLARKQMIKRNAFFFMHFPTSKNDTLLFIQTSKSYLVRDTIDSPYTFLTFAETPLRKTNHWKIKKAESFPSNDIEGVTNPTLPIRWLTLNVINHYVPFLKQDDPRVCAVALNLLWRLHNSVDPLPQGLPTIYKIGFNRIATYNFSESPSEILQPPLGATLDYHDHCIGDSINAIATGIILASWIHHPDFNLRVLLSH